MEIVTIYGPPGTGKSKTLIDLVEQEIVQGTPISRIAYVAFTKKATIEVQDRMSEKFSLSLNEMQHVRTLHSMAFRAVRASANQMMNASKYVDFGKKSGFNLKGYYNPEEGMSSKDDDFIMIEQLYRNNKKYCDKLLDEIDHKRFVYFIQMYQKYKNTFNYLDFTDLLNLYIEQGRVQDVDIAFIDEAQDLTTLQWRVAMAAFKNVKRLYVAGDDDQAIYQWSGADVDLFLKLRGRQIILEKSYRLPNYLVNKAKVISGKIHNRINKEYSGLAKEGNITFINDISELKIDPNEPTYLLARNNYLLEDYKNFCMDRRYLFNIKGKNFITEEELNALRIGADIQADADKISYLNDVGYRSITEEPMINVSTIHGVKGGEANHVVIMSNVTRSCAKQLMLDEDAEHRCFYVALTRAKCKVTVILPTSKNNYPYLSEV
jgi:superfamily I DNA/RNA helicase